jgi:hypothetical protein
MSSDRERLFLGDWTGGLVVSRYLGLSRYVDWQRIQAHAGRIVRIFTGADPRFVATVGDDGFKIWDARKLTLIWSRQSLYPRWVSDDFRFLVEDSGLIWELQWLYTFGTPLDSEEQSIRRHVEAHLECRRALSEITGVKRDWGPSDSAQLFQRLAKHGFGYLSAAYIDSYVREHFRELI